MAGGVFLVLNGWGGWVGGWVGGWAGGRAGGRAGWVGGWVGGWAVGGGWAGGAGGWVGGLMLRLVCTWRTTTYRLKITTDIKHSCISFMTCFMV